MVGRAVSLKESPPNDAPSPKRRKYVEAMRFYLELALEMSRTYNPAPNGNRPEHRRPPAPFDHLD